MIAPETIYMTHEGWRRLQEELRDLRRQHGSRTAEYTSILMESEAGEAGLRYMQAEVTTVGQRLSHLEDILSRATPIGPDEMEPGVVSVGSSVLVRWEDGEDESFVLVGPPEVDVEGNRISYESPVGRALMGRRSSDLVEVTTPGGGLRLRVMAVEPASPGSGKEV